MDETQDSVLQSFIKIAPYFPMFFEEPVSIAISDTEKYIYKLAAEELPVKSEVGSLLPPEGTCGMVIKTGERIVREVSEKVHGIPFVSYAVPIRGDNGRVCGCLLIAKAIVSVKKAKNSVEILATDIQQVTNATGSVVAGAQETAANSNEICQLISDLSMQAEQMNSILAFINKISNSTKILGLNAVIEAARVGEAGRGFSVVAKEIEKMSGNTTDAARKIGSMLEEIQEKLTIISQKATQTAEASTGQVTDMEQVAKTLQQIKENVDVLDQYVQKL